MLLIHETSSFFSILQLLEKKKTTVVELGHFGFDLGIHIGLNSLESVSGKQSFLFSFIFFLFLQLKEVLNTSVKHTQNQKRGKANIVIFMNSVPKLCKDRETCLGT